MSAGALLALAALAGGGEVEGPAHGEVAVIGVAHAPELFRSPAMSPAHLRACLEALRPGVVGVETDPDRLARDRFDPRSYEAETVTVPWALARGVAVYGVGGIVDDPGADARDAPEAEPGVPSSLGLGPARADEIRETAVGEAPGFLQANGAEYGRRRIAWIEAGREREGSTQARVAAGNARMAEHVAAAAALHPGARMVVVVGAGRKADLERLLALRGFRILGLGEVENAYPLDHPRSMDSLLTAMDAAAILLTGLDTGDWHLTDERARLLLGKLRDVPVAKARTWYRYAVARRAMLAGKDDAARGGFEHILEHEADAPFPYRGTVWRLHLGIHRAARLELGRLADLAGDREAAVGHYRALLDGLQAVGAAGEVEAPYRARAVEAVRALIRTPRASASPERLSRQAS